jgi:AraC-like DNA-binding protein
VNTRTVSSTYFLSAFNSCIDAGCNPVELAEILEVDELALNNPVARFPVQTYLKLLHTAEDKLGKSGVGVKIGQEFRPQTFRDIGYVAVSCKNIEQALTLNRRYQKLTQEIGTTQITFDGRSASIIWSPHSDDHEYMRPVTDAVFSGYFTMGLWMAWTNAGKVMSEVQFKHDHVPYADLFAQKFNCDVIFNAPANAMVFDTEAATRPLPQYNPQLVQAVSQRLDRALVQFDTTQLVQDQVYDTIEALLPSCTPTISQVAQLMHISERTLRRRLSSENMSFRELLQKVRQDSCDIHLRDHNISLTNLAHQLGYSEQSAFTHAFRSWYNMTPKQYSASLRANN